MRDSGTPRREIGGGKGFRFATVPPPCVVLVALSAAIW